MASSPPSPSCGNPWFAVSMGLLGLIVGYLVGIGGMSAPAGGPQLAAQPSPAPAAPAPTAPPPAPSAKDVKPVDPSRDHIRGNPDAKISVIEYSDFECPFCARHHPTMQKILDKYGDDVNWVYRHFPLSFHPNAQKAAEASECAAELGGNEAFWKLADIIFERGADNAKLVGYAKEIGLDEAEFTSCLTSGKYAQYVQSDMAAGSAAGVNGTPGNILLHHATGEARLVSGAQPLSAFTAVIDQMLSK